ncbi:uncharacterized protein LOC142230956 [Haematobia irritans]|uniref:uncharacterized protein LOC142230956 n=1 Tax=Haematobia irritans TaxID=7368 RepID=UPI003F4FA324
MYCIFSVECGKRPFNVHFHNVTCPAYTSLVKLAECDVIKVAKNKYALNVMFLLDRTLPTNVDLRFLFELTPIKGTKIIRILDAKMGICDLLEHSSKVPIIRDVMNEIRRKSNIPISCPVKGNMMYNITNIILTDAQFPLYTPIVYFNISLEFLQKEIHLVTYRLQGLTMQKKP